MSFKRAERKNAKLRLALTGTSGSGKTYSSLLLAREFGTKIAVLDSERGSASLYADLVPFDVCELEEKNIPEYLEKIREAGEAGYEVLVIDSFSHSWISALETVDMMSGSGSKFSSGWKVVSPMVTKLVDAILSYPGHVIATMRSKAEYVLEENEKGKKVPRKVGMASVARDGTDYEFSIMLDLSVDGVVTVSKTRCSALAGGIYPREEIPKIAKTIRAWLDSGAQQTARDVMAERIRFAKDDAALAALVPEMQKLAEEDRKALRDVYLRRKAEFQQ